MSPRIIDPMPSGPLPIMHTIQDAAKLNVQENTTFYVSAYLFQVWICELTLANNAQLAERPNPAQRTFQAGQAWRGFQKYFGKASDAELPTIFSDLMQFGDCDDPIAAHVLEAAFPLSVEHELTGEFIGSRTPRELGNNNPRAVFALIRATLIRLCDWLDSALHFRLFQEWHVMPDCFDPDPQKRELACLGISQRHFDRLSEHAQARFLNHLADAAIENKNSPKWAAFRQTASNEAPTPRPWPTQNLDCAIIKLWPLLKRHHWSAADLMFVLGNVLQPADLAPCAGVSDLVSYCSSTLGLRWASHSKSHQLSSLSRNQKSKIKNQKSIAIALRLFDAKSSSPALPSLPPAKRDQTGLNRTKPDSQL